MRAARLLVLLILAQVCVAMGVVACFRYSYLLSEAHRGPLLRAGTLSWIIAESVLQPFEFLAAVWIVSSMSHRRLVARWLMPAVIGLGSITALAGAALAMEALTWFARVAPLFPTPWMRFIHLAGRPVTWMLTLALLALSIEPRGGVRRGVMLVAAGVAGALLVLVFLTQLSPLDMLVGAGLNDRILRQRIGCAACWMVILVGLAVYLRSLRAATQRKSTHTNVGDAP